jgi:polyisoprenoid-binding protein YceI
MAKFFIVLVIAGAAVGGYLYYQSDNRADVGDPMLSVSPDASASGTPQALADGTYVLVASSSSMQWEGRKTLIVNYVDTGTIRIKEGSATVSGGAVTSGSVVVDMTTISTDTTGRGSGQDMQEKHIKGADFFDVEKYPTSTFAFQSISAADAAGKVTVTGTLTIKDVAQPVSFPATLTAEGDTLTMRATATLDRTLWGIKYGSGKFFTDLGDKVIDDMFTVSFTAVGTLQK